MNLLARLTLCACLAVLAWTGWQRTGGQGIASEDSGLVETLDSRLGAAETLEERCQVVTKRIEAKRQLLDELLEGRRDLFETAACFRNLDQGDAQYNWTAFRLFYSGATDDERHCREVLASLEAALSLDGCMSAAVLNRLQRDLQERLGNGPISLPLE